MNPLLIVIAVLLIANVGLLCYAAHLLDSRARLGHLVLDAIAVKQKCLREFISLKNISDPEEALRLAEKLAIEMRPPPRSVKGRKSS